MNVLLTWALAASAMIGSSQRCGAQEREIQIIEKPGQGRMTIIINGEIVQLPEPRDGTIHWQLDPPEPFEFPASSVNIEDIDPALRATIKQLDDPSFEVREAATIELRQADAKHEGDLAAMLESDALTAEQRSRLVMVMCERVRERPRGALGVRMQQAPVVGVAGQQPEVQVIDFVPGLPASKSLRILDRITHLDGHRVSSTMQLINLIQSRQPGNTVKLTVKRPRSDEQGEPVLGPDNRPAFETLEVEIELGSSELLDIHQPQFGQASAVEQARQYQASSIAYRYAPRPQAITVKSLPGTDQPDASSLSYNDIWQEIDHESEVDQHAAIQSLLHARELMAQGRLGASAQNMRMMWAAQLRHLREMAAAPGLPALERKRLTRVAERFAELMED